MNGSFKWFNGIKLGLLVCGLLAGSGATAFAQHGHRHGHHGHHGGFHGHHGHHGHGHFGYGHYGHGHRGHRHWHAGYPGYPVRYSVRPVANYPVYVAPYFVPFTTLYGIGY